MNKMIITLVLWCATFYVQAAGALSGKIINAINGEPLPGATIYIHEYERGIVSNEDGEFKLSNLPNHPFTLEISFIGFETNVVHVSHFDPIEIKLRPTFIETAEVVITGSNYSSQHENAIKIERIDIEKLTHSGTPSFIESLAAIPGVDVISKGYGIAKPVIRGMSNSNLLFLNNGIKIDNYQFSENHPYVVDETGLGGVEVIKGPASLLYGADAIGGLINLLPEHPAPVGKTQGDLTLRGNAPGSGFSINGGIKNTTSGMSWGLRGAMRSYQDYIDGTGGFVPNSRFSQQSAKTFLSWNSSRGIFKINYSYNRLIPGMTNTAVKELVGDNGFFKSVWYQDLTNHTLQSRNTFFIDKIKFQANMAYSLNHRILNTDEENEVNMQLGGLNYELRSWLTINDKQSIILGFQGAHRSNQNNEAHTRVLPDYKETESAVTALYQFKIEDRLSLQSGVRIDYRNLFVPEQELDSHSHDETKEEHAPETMPQLKLNYLNPSGSVGLTYELAHELLLRTNVASAFRPPNVAELAQDGIHGVRYEKGNVNLNSQRNIEGDMSLHYHLERFSADIAGFYNHIFNYIFLAPTSEVKEDYLVYQYQQTNSKLFGSEIDLRYQPISWLELMGNLSLIRGNQQNGDNLPFIPHDQLKLAFQFELPRMKQLEQSFLNIAFEHAFEQKRPSVFETSTSGYSLVDVKAGTTIVIGNNQLLITLHGNNVLNANYFDHLSTLKDLGYYNPGRNLGGSVSYKF